MAAARTRGVQRRGCHGGSGVPTWRLGGGPARGVGGGVDVAQTDSRLRLDTQERGENAMETLKRKPGLLKKAINGE